MGARSSMQARGAWQEAGTEQGGGAVQGGSEHGQNQGEGGAGQRRRVCSSDRRCDEREVAFAHNVVQRERLCLPRGVQNLCAARGDVHALDLDEVPQVVIRPIQLGLAPSQRLADVGVREQSAGRLGGGRRCWLGGSTRGRAQVVMPGHLRPHVLAAALARAGGARHTCGCSAAWFSPGTSGSLLAYCIATSAGVRPCGVPCGCCAPGPPTPNAPAAAAAAAAAAPGGAPPPRPIEPSSPYSSASMAATAAAAACTAACAARRLVWYTLAGSLPPVAGPRLMVLGPALLGGGGGLR